MIEIKNVGVMIIAGIFVFLVGIWCMFAPVEIYKECTEPVTAVVTDITSKTKKNIIIYWENVRKQDDTLI